MKSKEPKAKDPKAEEAFALLAKMDKAFKKLGAARQKPCIGQCNTDCGGLEPSHRRTTNFYTNNAA